MIAVALVLPVALVAAPAPVGAEPRALERTVRIGFMHLTAPDGCPYCAPFYAPGIEVAFARPLADRLDLRGQLWWYQGSGEGSAKAITIGVGARSGPWTARVSVGGQAVELHEGDGGNGNSVGLVGAVDGAVETGRFGALTTELQLRYARAFAAGGSNLFAIGYGVVW